MWGCLGCYTAFENKPVQDYEDGHGGREINMCRCGSDLFVELEKNKEGKWVVINRE